MNIAGFSTAIVAFAVSMPLGHAQVISKLGPDKPIPENVRVIFRKGDNLDGAAVRAIEGAQTEILAALPALPSMEVALALAEAFKRKVVVGIVLPVNAPNSDVLLFLNKLGIPYVCSDRVREQGYCVVDRRILLAGSFCASRSVLSRNYLMVFDEPGIAAAFIHEWMEELSEAFPPHGTSLRVR